MNIKTQRHLSRLIFRYLRDRLNEEESRELERWRAASEAHELLFRRLLSSAHWQRSIGRFVKNESDTQSEWEIIRQRTVGRDRGKRTIRWYRYAAAIFLPLLIASGYFIKLSRTPQEKTLVSVPFIPGKSYAVLELADGTSIDLGETAVRGQIQGGHWEVRSDSLKYCEEGVKGGEEYHTLKVPRGGEYTLVLADGSKVFLNAESSLKYPVLFSGDLRKVKLEGEAYFEVKRNPEKPFVVDIGGMQVNVLGTTFGIRAYADEREIRTTLVSGRVNVSAGKQVYELKPSEQAVFDKQTGIECRFAGVLQHTDDEAHGHHLHRGVLVDAEKTAGKRNQHEGPPGNTRSARRTDRGDEGEENRGGNVDCHAERVRGREREHRDRNRGTGHIDGHHLRRHDAVLHVQALPVPVLAEEPHAPG